MIPLLELDHRRGRTMMGRNDTCQGQLFYSFDLDEVVPADYLVREIDRVLDLFCATILSETGRIRSV